MNWINFPCKPAALAVLLLLPGSGMAAAAVPVAVPQNPLIAAAPGPSPRTPPAAGTELIRVAWDRVGAQA